MLRIDLTSLFLCKLLNLFQILDSAAVSQQVKMDSVRRATIWRFWNIVTHRLKKKNKLAVQILIPTFSNELHKSDIFTAVSGLIDMYGQRRHILWQKILHCPSDIMRSNEIETVSPYWQNSTGDMWYHIRETNF